MNPSPYGVNAHLLYDEGLELLAKAGIRWVRFDLDWPHVEPERGQYDWTQVDRLVATSRRLGMSTLAVIAYTPTWASGSSDIHAPARDPALFVEFVHRAVERYGPEAVSAWSVWNEPNLRQFWTGGQSQFIHQFYVPALRELRAVRPDATIVGPDLTGSRAMRGWFPEIFRAAGRLLDVIAHHQYDGADTLSGRLLEIHRVHETMVQNGAGDLPLWITEIGWDRVSPARQGELLQGVMHGMQMTPWWAKTFWYDSDGRSDNGQWGLLGAYGEPDAGQPRPAYFAYQAVIDQDAASSEGH